MGKVEDNKKVTSPVKKEKKVWRGRGRKGEKKGRHRGEEQILSTRLIG